MTREEIEALATQHGMLGQMATTNLLVRFAELVAAEKPVPELTDEEIDACRRPGLIDSLLDPYDRDNSGNECSSMYIDLRKFARAVIAADRAKRGG